MPIEGLEKPSELNQSDADIQADSETDKGFFETTGDIVLMGFADWLLPDKPKDSRAT